MKIFIGNKLYYLIGILLLFIVWEISGLIIRNNVVFPDFLETIKELGVLLTKWHTYKVILLTFLRAFISVFCSLFVALILAYFSKKSKKFKAIISPLISVVKSIPVIALIVIMIIYVGHENSSMIIMSFVIMPILYEGILLAMNSITKEIKDETRIVSKNNIRVIKDVYIPLTMPIILVSILQSFALGLKALITSEFLTQPSNSIGSEILMLKNNLEMSKLFAWVLILILIVITIELLVNYFKEKANKNLA